MRLPFEQRTGAVGSRHDLCGITGLLPDERDAADVEVTQDDVAQAVGAASVAQHDLGHQLRGAIGRRRLRGIVFTHRCAVGIAVDRAVEEKMKWRTRPLKARSSARASSPYCCGNSRLDREPSQRRRGEMDKWITASTWYSTINFKSS